MTKTQKLSRVWTDAVAYVALILGAGVSIAGNVADTFRTRGSDTDTLDIVMAVLWPGLVVLMVEVFVSARWRGLPWPMQVLRWAGTLSIGVMAMRVSWVHLNDLMVSRGQAPDVSTLGPLAIDALAIMATALILAGRKPAGQDALALDSAASLGPGMSGVLAAERTLDMDRQMSDVQARRERLGLDTSAQDTTVDIDLEDTLSRYGIGHGVPSDAELADAMDRMADTPAPVEPSAAARRAVAPTNPLASRWDEDEAQTFVLAGLAHRVPTGQIDALLGGYYGKSAKSIQRFRADRALRPVSAPPAS